MGIISFTTACLNSAHTLEKCIASVRDFEIENLEYSVIDGASTDQTKAILEDAFINGAISRYVSEPDNGISHAFNKGWLLSSGKYVVNINADDWFEPNYYETLNGTLKEQNPDIVICALRFVGVKKDRVLKPKIFSEMPPKKWFNPIINYPGMAIRRSLIEQCGGYDENYKVAMDIDFFYRMLQFKPKIVILDDVLVNQRDCGISQKQWMIALSEMHSIELKFGRNPIAAKLAFFFRVIKVATKRALSGFI